MYKNFPVSFKLSENKKKKEYYFDCYDFPISFMADSVEEGKKLVILKKKKHIEQLQEVQKELRKNIQAYMRDDFFEKDFSSEWGTDNLLLTICIDPLEYDVRGKGWYEGHLVGYRISIEGRDRRRIKTLISEELSRRIDYWSKIKDDLMNHINFEENLIANRIKSRVWDF